MNSFIWANGATMKVADILRIKGSVVKTVSPHETAMHFAGSSLVRRWSSF